MNLRKTVPDDADGPTVQEIARQAEATGEDFWTLIERAAAKVVRDREQR